MRGRDDATFSATDRNRFGSTRSKVQWREAALSMYHRSRESVERVFDVVVEVLCIIGRRADCSGGSDYRISGFGGKGDGMGKLDLLLRQGSTRIVTCRRWQRL